MRIEDLHLKWETVEGEYLKTAAEFGLHNLSRSTMGRRIIEIARGGERIVDPKLNIEVAGIHFENPVMVGAGWDKKGWVVDGLYELGFAGEEIGSALLHPQKGNSRPRLWYAQGIGRNAMGFNSPGSEKIKNNLSTQERKGVVGINISRNKLSAEDHSPEDFAATGDILYDYADYFVINFMSPNTPGLRDSMMRLLKDSFIALNEMQDKRGKRKPTFVKTSIDMSERDILDTIQIAIDVGAAGIIDTNTTVEEALKERYGWEGKPGGLSGNDPDYRRKATERMKLITRESRGTGLARIGVGAISDSASAIERIQAGAQLVQVVTGIRQNKAKTAQNINRGVLVYMNGEGINCVEDMAGIAA